MESPLSRMTERIDRMLPPGSSRRKVVQLLSIILVIEGLSVIFLFSYVGLWLGLASLLAGIAVLTVLRPGQRTAQESLESPGSRLIDSLVRLFGGEYGIMAVGAAIVSLVILYNHLFSARPELGDVDTICLLFGVALLLHPLLYGRYREEMSFVIIFVGFLVVFLALPQIVQSLSSGEGTSTVGDWYVHYMLAAPFAGILDLIGIPASSSGNLVTLQFQDGTVSTLSISAYCAGLYSFSIFLSAFFAFVLVFERLPNRLYALVLTLGIVIAYVGNILRMVVIGVVGYYWGLDALHWFHENVGWMVFLGWSLLFWWFILGYTSRYAGHAEAEETGAN